MDTPGSQSKPLELKLARLLGLFSIGLGGPQVAAPGRMNRLIGVRDGSGARRWQRLVGIRELAVAPGLITRPWPVAWAWTRVAGDLGDLVLLGLAAGRKPSDRKRLAGAIGSVAGTAALDVYTAMRLSTGRQATSPIHVKAAVTVRRPLAEVFEAWSDFENLPVFMEHLEHVESLAGGRSRWRAKAPAGQTVEWEAEVVSVTPNEVIEWRSVAGSDVQHSGAVGFRPAPGDQGTEVHVDLEYGAPAGRLGAAVAHLFGEEPMQQVKDDLRRFKQVMETGEVARSDSAPEGAGGRGFVKQRPGQPLEARELVETGGGSR